MTQFVRGSAITFRANCTDAAGQSFTPTSARLSLSYVSALLGARACCNLPMTIDGSEVSAVWDSSVASDGMPVVWHIRAGGVAQDGTFRLTAAEANPAAPQAK